MPPREMVCGPTAYSNTPSCLRVGDRLQHCYHALAWGYPAGIVAAVVVVSLDRGDMSIIDADATHW
jgi:hypothetical protein